MSDMRERILERLAQESPAVKELAGRAIQLSGEQSEASAVEQLKALVRKLVRDGGSNDPE